MPAKPCSPQEIRDARDFAIKMLDDYHFSLEVMVEVLGVSARTIQRRRPKLEDRPSGLAYEDHLRAALLSVLILMARKGFRTEVIAKVLDLKQSTVHRIVAQADEKRAAWEEKKEIQRAKDISRWGADSVVGSGNESPLRGNVDQGSIDHDLPMAARLDNQARRIQRRVSPKDRAEF